MREGGPVIMVGETLWTISKKKLTHSNKKLLVKIKLVVLFGIIIYGYGKSTVPV